MKRDAGFSLIEVLVATAITVIVLALSLQAFRGGLDANTAVRLMADTNENLQVALARMSDDLTKAGQDLPVGGVAIPYAGATPATPVRWPIAGEPSLPYATTLYYVTPGDELGPKVSDTLAGTAMSDVISVLYKDSSLPDLPVSTTTVNATDSVVTIRYTPTNPTDPGVQINGTTPNKIVVGDYFALTGVNGTIIQAVTDAVDTANPQQITFRLGDAMAFNQPTYAQGSIAMLTAGGPVTSAKRVFLVTYYLDRTTPTQPMLMRRVNGRPAEAIAVGIEQLQLSYDLVSGGASFVNVPAPAGAQTPNNIRKVRLFIGARSEMKPNGKGYFRNSVSTQINIRSLGLFDQFT
jgi:prepilin-type N-terminal cleavage/methylation domain-containing protein